MNENILQYIWKNQRFNNLNLKTTEGNSIQILNPGNLNTNQGIDFLNAEIKIDDLNWFGNVEIHVKSSDYYLHNHQNQSEYQQIILHVVFYNDLQIKELENKNIHTLELKNFIDKKTLLSIQSIDNESYNFIPCEHLLLNEKITLNKEDFKNLYTQKLEEKHKEILQELKFLKGNWEALLFMKIAYTFGLKINADLFSTLAKEIDFTIIKKIAHSKIWLEALFFGFFNELNDPKDDFQKILNTEYIFLKHKFLIPDFNYKLNYLRLRPGSFPTIRLSQLADLYHKNQNLFSNLIENFSESKINMIFNQVVASDYWINHYVFNKKSNKNHSIILSDSMINSLIINAILPIKYSYNKFLDKNNDIDIFKLLSNLKVEKNIQITNWNSLDFKIKTALESQSFLFLYKNYCLKKKCLSCVVGNKILK